MGGDVRVEGVAEPSATATGGDTLPLQPPLMDSTSSAASHPGSNAASQSAAAMKGDVEGADSAEGVDGAEEEGEDDAWDAMQERQYASLIAAGTHTPAQIERMRQERRFKEEAAVCGVLTQTRAWEHDPTCSARNVFLCHATALEGLGRWPEAIQLLQRAAGVLPGETAITLALAKLHFKAGRKEEALALCTAVYQAYSEESGEDAAGATKEDAADAYHLAGWVKIHGDDHTTAYALWSAGAAAIPDDPVLRTQKAKRQCWDAEGAMDAVVEGLVGDGAHGDGVYDMATDLEGFAVAPSKMACTPALALFNPEVQQRRVVFLARQPVLTPAECQRVCGIVEEFHARERGGVWSTVRKATVKTTDVAVEDIAELRPWLRELLHTRLYPLAAAAYPRLADGSTLTDPASGKSRLRVHDAFIVRYDAEKDGSFSLPEHSDTSVISFTVALNGREKTFQGGGTWFEALGDEGMVVDAEVGQAVAFAGPLRHAGFPITRGCRIILVLFLYAEDFPYGHFLEGYRAEHGGCRKEVEGASEAGENVREKDTETRPSGDAPGGYVVYKQTVQLMEMLNKQAASSVLD